MEKSEPSQLDALVSLTKRRGFIYPSSEIYGGLGGIYDYGHYGVLLKENIQNSWIRHMTQLREDISLLDSAIFMHPKTWIASGHVAGFNDPQVECRNCHNRMRADILLEKFNINADKASIEFINEKLDELKKDKKITCDSCGSTDLTQAKVFSLMVKSNLGLITESYTEEEVTYLRPETCGGIYLNYKNVLDTLHPKIPFGIAQVGKAFRNEIAARQFIFRTREFEQMEMQYFIHEQETKSTFNVWKQIRYDWYLHFGVNKDKLRFHDHETLAHYAKAAVDIEYHFSIFNDFKEIEGVHARGNWDLTQHSNYSGIPLDYYDEESKERFIPHIIETSAGLGRLVLLFLDNAYTEEELDGEMRVVLKFHSHLAPIKCAVFPLLRNKPELMAKAKELYQMLQPIFRCEFDDSGNIGKRYRRQDEIGTPYCITVDFDTLSDGTVTIRDRDTAKQVRINSSDLISYLTQKLL